MRVEQDGKYVKLTLRASEILTVTVEGRPAIIPREGGVDYEHYVTKIYHENGIKLNLRKTIIATATAIAKANRVVHNLDVKEALGLDPAGVKQVNNAIPQSGKFVNTGPGRWELKEEYHGNE